MFYHAVILAAGRGIRLIYMTSRIPKALVDVCGMPLINYSDKNNLKSLQDDFKEKNNLKERRIKTKKFNKKVKHVFFNQLY